MLDLSNPESLRRDHHYECQYAGRSWQFETTWGLFSPKALDEGTDLLMEHMAVKSTDRSLDLGCGYGPMGLAMAAQAPQGHCTLVDKDFVAVDYAQRNAKRNGIENVSVYLSNGFSHVPMTPKFDLVASNLPAKVGKELFYLYFHDAKVRLDEGGRFYVVSITGLRKFVERAFKEVFGNYDKIKQGKTYTVAMAYKQ
ncbi:MAG: class I SAM-dependent methyltransferase [Gammaproteobacteria bacterium]|nr:class I SAM-dependent methyltransferase [Gammaproteobacteria bacterium]